MAVIQDFRVRKGLIVSENTSVAGNVAISQQLSVTNSVSFSNTLAVTGTSTLTGNTSIGGFANVGSTLQVTGISTFGAANATFDTSTLTIDALNNRVGVNTALGQTVAFVVTGDANVSGTFTAANINFTNITGTSLTVGTGNSQFDSGVLFIDAVNNRVGINNTTPDASLTVTGTANVAAALRVGGTTTLNSTLAVTDAATFSNTTAHTGAATFSSTLGVTGAVTFSNTSAHTGAATFSNTMSVTGTATFTSTILGSVNGNSNTCSRTVTAGSFLSGGGALSADVTLNVLATSSNTVSYVVSRDISGNFSAGTITASLSGTATAANTLLYAGGNRSATDAATGNSIMARDLNGDTYARYFRGTATSSLYADLAELYLTDKQYPVGTVVKIGGDKEITEYTCLDYIRALGTISENPAFLMNRDLEGGQPVALKGRVPIRVVGYIKKGQGLGASALPGVATMNNVNYFAIAMEDYESSSEGIIEGVIL